jgi:hypothetical protein
MLHDLVDPMFAAVEKNPRLRPAVLSAIDQATPRVVEVASTDPKLFATITETVLKAAMKDKAALKELLKKLAID